MDEVKVKAKLWLVYDKYPQAPELAVVCFTSKKKAKQYVKEMNEDSERFSKPVLYKI